MGFFESPTDRFGDLFNFFVRPLSKLFVSDAHLHVREKHEKGYTSLSLSEEQGIIFKAFLGQEQGQAFGVPEAHPTLKFGDFPPPPLGSLSVSFQPIYFAVTHCYSYKLYNSVPLRQNSIILCTTPIQSLTKQFSKTKIKAWATYGHTFQDEHVIVVFMLKIIVGYIEEI